VNHRKLTFQFILVLLAAAIPGLNWAQTSNGILVGSVVDPTDAVVPKATVSAVSAQFGAPHETQTDAVGTYRLESLQPGTYAVTINASGFKTLTVMGVVINGSLATTINGKLELATAQEVIEVQATALQAIDTQSGQLGGNLSSEEVSQLPYTSFNPAELALMRRIALYPRIVEAAAAAHEPHRIAFYLFDLASEFHALYTLGNASPHLRFIIQDDRQRTEARLVLVQGVATVLASGLNLLGVAAPDEMR